MRCRCLRSWWDNIRILRNDINKVVTIVTCYSNLYVFTFLSPDCSNPTPAFSIPIADSSTIKVRAVSGWLLNVEGRRWSLDIVNGTGYSSTIPCFRFQHLYTNSPHSYFIHNLCYWRNKSSSIFCSQLDTFIAWVLAYQKFDISVSALLMNMY